MHSFAHKALVGIDQPFAHAELQMHAGLLLASCKVSQSIASHNNACNEENKLLSSCISEQVKSHLETVEAFPANLH